MSATLAETESEVYESGWQKQMICYAEIAAAVLQSMGGTGTIEVYVDCKEGAPMSVRWGIKSARGKLT